MSFLNQEILLKAMNYCAYQERCHQEVRNKLYELGCKTDTVDEIMVKLIESNYLNEERFAKSYAGGKFRTKKWGRLRILKELQIRKISDYCIKVAMREIDEGVYLETVEDLLIKYLPAQPTFNDRQKAMRYLMGKGYEPNLIKMVLDKISNP
jgi:regulatory protein